MKKQNFSVPTGMLAGACLCLLSITGCKKNAIPETADSNTTGTAKIAAATNTSFSFLRGADVGFLTEMEKNSNTFFNTSGSNRDANYTETNSHTGTYRMTHWKSTAYNVSTYQTITGLTNGLYTFQAWVRSPYTMVTNYLFAKDFGGSQVNVNIPIDAKWKKITDHQYQRYQWHLYNRVSNKW